MVVELGGGTGLRATMKGRRRTQRRIFVTRWEILLVRLYTLGALLLFNVPLLYYAVTML